MKQLSRIFLSLALLVPAIVVADNCNNSCTTTTNDCTNTRCDGDCNSTCASSVSCNANSCGNNSCNQSCCFNSCGTSVCNTSCDNVAGCPTLLIKRQHTITPLSRMALITNTDMTSANFTADSR